MMRGRRLRFLARMRTMKLRRMKMGNAAGQGHGPDPVLDLDQILSLVKMIY